MNVSARLAAQAILFLAAAALVSVGVGFLGYALFAGFAPVTGSAGAAALAGAILLLPVLLAYAVFAARGVAQDREEAARRAAEKAATPQHIGLSLLAGLAKDRPLIAVISAAILGAVSSLLNRKS